MTPELVKIGVSESGAGYMLSIISFSYLIGCVLLPYTCGNTARKWLFFLAFLGFTVSMLLIGPSKYLKLPPKVWMVLPGYPILGICQIFVFIPIIPEMIERLQVQLQIAEGEDEVVDLRLNDQVNEAYTLIYALSSFVSPILGSQLYLKYGFRTTFDMVAAANLVYAGILFTFNCGPAVFLEDRKFKQELDTLNNKIKTTSI